MVIREAFALGTPVAVSEIGPLPTIVRSGVEGLVFPPGQPLRLAEVVRTAWRDQAKLERLGCNARAAFEHHYGEHAAYESLMRIYESATHSRPMRNPPARGA